MGTDVAETEYAIFKQGDPVKWKSRIGYTYTGTVTRFVPDSNDYEILCPDGSTAIVDREFVEPDAPAGAAQPDPDLTPEQRAAKVRQMAAAQARQHIVDATMSAFTTLREGLDESHDNDELRLEAARLTVEIAGDVQTQIVERVEAKRAKQ